MKNFWRVISRVMSKTERWTTLLVALTLGAALCLSVCLACVSVSSASFSPQWLCALELVVAVSLPVISLIVGICWHRECYAPALEIYFNAHDEWDGEI